jgi:hypothetical protein
MSISRRVEVAKACDELLKIMSGVFLLQSSTKSNKIK